ncbi:hypothetical protein [Streptomyces sp. NBC_00448]|uniref:hypothetical protein n=1 Tax=Streptomyces sp. NBC_00448 TaxID=2903652 RepID=UPI002E226A19
MSGIGRRGHLPRGAVRLSACAAGAVVLALAVSGCSSSPSGPKAKDSAVKMAADARWVAAKERRYGKPTTPFTVTQDGTKAVSCGHDKASYSFAGHQTFTIGPVDTYLNVTTSSSAGLLANRGYIVDIGTKTDNGDYDSHMSKPLVNKKTRIHLTVTATASSDHASTEVWAVTAHTDCLRTG